MESRVPGARCPRVAPSCLPRAPRWCRSSAEAAGWGVEPWGLRFQVFSSVFRRVVQSVLRVSDVGVKGPGVCSRR